MPPPFQSVMRAEKLVAGNPEWSAPEGEDKRIKVIAPLMIEGRVFRGLELIGRANLGIRNADMSFSLVYLPTDNRRDAVPMARLDWRPKTPHTNEHPGSPDELLGQEIVGTHHHSFDLNWSHANSRPLKWLPIAEGITPDYQSVMDYLDAVGKFFRISNAGSALGSPWPQDLFDR